MSSKLFSKSNPTPTSGRSFYENLRHQREDVEDRAGLLDEENLNHDFHDYDLDHAEGLGVEDSHTTVGGGVTSPAARGRARPGGRRRRDARPTWGPNDDDEDNDVPASLLVELNEGDLAGPPGHLNRGSRGKLASANLGPSTTVRPQWEATAHAQQRLRNDTAFAPPRPAGGPPNSLFAEMVSGDAKKKAQWRWANVSNLDIFMKYVYDYYLGSGIWCIIVERGLHLL